MINLNNEHKALSSPLDIQSISGGDDDDDYDSVEMIANQLAEMNCQGEEEEPCDDSDSLDEALDAENLDDDNGNYFNSSNITTDVQ